MSKLSKEELTDKIALLLEDFDKDKEKPEGMLILWDLINRFLGGAVCRQDISIKSTKKYIDTMSKNLFQAVKQHEFCYKKRLH